MSNPYYREKIAKGIKVSLTLFILSIISIIILLLKKFSINIFSLLLSYKILIIFSSIILLISIIMFIYNFLKLNVLW